ncbi:hypothetical protein [Amycolatopsis sp. NPDC051071]|uniref:hypothetical protein n=1 Tax=Amycolatopsis sp. NPDC051071 TaxID=3154637 RepID=UPI00343A0001
MTSPQDPRDLIRQHDEEAQAVEDQAVAEVVGPVESVFTALWRWVLRTWARLFGAPKSTAEGEPLRSLLDELVARIVGIGLNPADALLANAQRARLLGADQGAREIGIPTLADPGEVLPETREAIARGVRWAQQKLETGADELRKLDTADLDEVLKHASVARQAKAILERTARTTFNTELNEGLVAAAKATGAQLVWIAEHDACLACTGLAGHVVTPGRPFPDGRRFGGRRGEFAPVLAPPLHHNCRCRVSPWMGHDKDKAEAATHDWADAIKDAQERGDQVAVDAARKAAAAAKQSATVDLPEALRREAERAVLRGDSAFDGERARLSAADRLLAKVGADKNAPSPYGWKVPASVKAKARAAIKRGTFTARPVSTGRK